MRDEYVNHLARRFSLSLDASLRLQRLVELLTEAPGAPTALREPRRAVDDHVADSLVALELEEVQAARDIVDIGSGAGVPALPLAIALPPTHVTALESNRRKAAFIASAIGELGLSNVAAVTARAEGWREGLTRFDVVTARALAPLDVVAEYAAPLLRREGVLVAWRGRRDPEAEAAAAAAASLLGLEVGPVVAVQPYAAAEHRHLHVLRKVQETPPRFPRREGMARKRPLGASARGSDRSPR